ARRPGPDPRDRRPGREPRDRRRPHRARRAAGRDGRGVPRGDDVPVRGVAHARGRAAGRAVGLPRARDRRGARRGRRRRHVHPDRRRPCHQHAARHGPGRRHRLRQDPPVRRVRVRRVRHGGAGGEADDGDRRRDDARARHLLRHPLPRALPRPRRPGRHGDAAAGELGRGPGQGRAVAAPGARAGRRRDDVRARRRPGRPGEPRHRRREGAARRRAQPGRVTVRGDDRRARRGAGAARGRRRPRADPRRPRRAAGAGEPPAL
ncbi:MAG: Aliphatic amidase AmiE, partial [uncultured Actinomycetospora sp.]